MEVRSLARISAAGTGEGEVRAKGHHEGSVNDAVTGSVLLRLARVAPANQNTKTSPHTLFRTRASS